METDTLESLRDLSQPARIYVGDEIETQAWPQAKFLLDLWQKKRGSREAPQRADLTPREMLSVLPLVTLSDVEQEPFRLKSRVVGTAVVDAIGFDPTGRYADEFPNTELMHRRSRWIADHRAPLMVLGAPLVWSPKDFKSYDILFLPLVDDGGQTNMLLYVHRYHVSRKN